jgi:hypothetical protein
MFARIPPIRQQPIRASTRCPSFSDLLSLLVSYLLIFLDFGLRVEFSSTQVFLVTGSLLWTPVSLEKCNSPQLNSRSVTQLLHVHRRIGLIDIPYKFRRDTNSKELLTHSLLLGRRQPLSPNVSSRSLLTQIRKRISPPSLLPRLLLLHLESLHGALMLALASSLLSNPHHSSLIISRSLKPSFPPRMVNKPRLVKS